MGNKLQQLEERLEYVEKRLELQEKGIINIETKIQKSNQDMVTLLINLDFVIIELSMIVWNYK